MATVMKTTRDVKGIGLSIPRPDGPEKVTGQVQYVADLSPRGLLHAKLLRSPHAHARILRIDVSRARALPGVRAVLTAADIQRILRVSRPVAYEVMHACNPFRIGRLPRCTAEDFKKYLETRR